MIEKIKQNEPLYRALRTFIQAFVGMLLSSITIGGLDNLDKKTIISLVASAISAGLSAVMNISKSDDEEEVEENPTTVEEVD